MLTIITWMIMAVIVQGTSQISKPHWQEQWTRYKTQYHLTFETAMQEKDHFETFIDNKIKFATHNNQIPSSDYQLGETPFTHLTNAQFQERFSFESNRRLMDQVISKPQPFIPQPSFRTVLKHVGKLKYYAEQPQATSFDWRNEPNSVISPVQHQGQCGSCWSFSATGSLYGCLHIKGHTTVPTLSNQQLVSCSTLTNGCSGGWSYYALQYIQNNGGINSDAAYPYTSFNGTTGACNTTLASISVATLTGIAGLNYNDQAGMKTWVEVNPLSISFQGSSYTFQHYMSGVITASDCWTGSIDHAALLIGYGTQSGTNYWTIKNQWGTSWGESGYVRIKRTNTASTPGICGVASYSVWPTCV